MTLSFSSRAATALLVAASIALPASAQDLKWGGKAPELSIEEWLKGAEVKAFEPGHIYVVEFWATWCPPCLRSIPHLTEVQKQYKDSKLTVIGVAASENPKFPIDEQRAGLAKFIEGKGDTMAYTIGFDSDMSMAKTWMDAARQGGIPTCFVVDGTGTVAWIGSPFSMDEPLAKIVSGKWDVQAELAKDAAKAEILTRAQGTAQAGDWDATLTHLDEAIKLGDDVLREVAGFKYSILLEKKDWDGAFAFIDKHMGGALKDEAELLNAIASSLIDPAQSSAYEKKDYDFALRCATRASASVKGKADEATMLDTLAAVHFIKNEFAKAVEVQTRVVELLAGKDEEVDAKATLERYKEAVSKG